MLLLESSGVLVKEELAKKVMQGVSITTLGNIGGLLASLVSFVILVTGYVLVIEKRPLPSDIVFYLVIFNIVLAVGLFVSWWYINQRSITVTD
jgi:ABC-type bacteriocin/lantibiotic exporter with double-glycine peptidase domain